MKKIIRKLLKIFNNIYNKVELYRKKVNFNKKLIINGRIKICSKGNLTFGSNIRINSGKNYNIIGGDTRTNLIVFNDAELIIGNNTGISNTTIVAKDKIVIGDYVNIGGGCKIYDTDFHSINYDERIMTEDPGIVSKPVYIKDGAFIGAHCIILKGVTIGEKAVVGAGSVVTKDIPPNEVWAGNPAKFIKKII